MHLERRRKRSDYTALALRYWLAAVAQRTRVVALVVGDSAGLLVASSLRGPEADELAAVAPLLMRADHRGETPLSRHHLPLEVERLSVDDSSLYVCAVGDKANCGRSLHQARAGVERILA